jgi:translation elongation factor EF-Tu-like GTPase
MQPLMAVDEVVRIRSKPLVVLGKLTGGPVRVGQALVLRSAAAELAAEVAWVSLGFDRVSPQRAEVGDNVALGLRGELLERVEGGGVWQVFAGEAEAESSAAADRGGM